MSYNEELAERLREILASQSNVTERKMFGGIGFMINGNMCCGVMKTGEVMLRVGAEKHDEALSTLPHSRVMDFNKRISKGFIYLIAEKYSDDELGKAIQLGLDFVLSLPKK
jgi:TfoX/Sxy family transcriptional regulator of competence genes